jgi:DNA repair exonuclease SbcCD ATPase subunit
MLNEIPPPPPETTADLDKQPDLPEKDAETIRKELAEAHITTKAQAEEYSALKKATVEALQASNEVKQHLDTEVETLKAELETAKSSAVAPTIGREAQESSCSLDTTHQLSQEHSAKVEQLETQLADAKLAAETHASGFASHKESSAKELAAALATSSALAVEVESLRKALEEAKTSHQESQSALESTKSELSEKTLLVSSHKATVAQSEAQKASLLSDHAAALAEKESEKNDLVSGHEAVLAERENEKTDLIRSHGTALDSNSEQLNAANEKIAQLSADVDRANQDNLNVQTALQVAQADALKLKVSLSGDSRAAVDALTKDLETAHTQVNQLTANLDAITKDHESAKSGLEAAHAEIAELEASAKRAIAQEQVLKEQLAALQEDLQTANSSHESGAQAAEARISELSLVAEQHCLTTTELESARAEIETLKKELVDHAALQFNFAASEARLAELQHELDSHIVSSSDLQRELDSHIVNKEAMQKELESHINAKASLQSELDEHVNSKANLQREIDEHVISKESLQKEIVALAAIKEEHELAQSRLQELSADSEAHTATKSELQAAHSRIEQLSKDSDDHTATKSELESTKAHSADLSQQLEDQFTSNSELETRIVDLEKEIESHATTKTDLEAAHAQIAELSEHTDKGKDASRELEAANAHIEELSQKLESRAALLVELDAANARIAELAQLTDAHVADKTVHEAKIADLSREIESHEAVKSELASARDRLAQLEKDLETGKVDHGTIQERLAAAETALAAAVTDHEKTLLNLAAKDKDLEDFQSDLQEISKELAIKDSALRDANEALQISKTSAIDHEELNRKSKDAEERLAAAEKALRVAKEEQETEKAAWSAKAADLGRLTQQNSLLTQELESSKESKTSTKAAHSKLLEKHRTLQESHAAAGTDRQIPGEPTKSHKSGPHFAEAALAGGAAIAGGFGLTKAFNHHKEKDSSTDIQEHETAPIEDVKPEEDQTIKPLPEAEEHVEDVDGTSGSVKEIEEESSNDVNAAAVPGISQEEHTTESDALPHAEEVHPEVPISCELTHDQSQEAIASEEVTEEKPFTESATSPLEREVSLVENQDSEHESPAAGLVDDAPGGDLNDSTHTVGESTITEPGAKVTDVEPPSTAVEAQEEDVLEPEMSREIQPDAHDHETELAPPATEAAQGSSETPPAAPGAGTPEPSAEMEQPIAESSPRVIDEVEPATHEPEMITAVEHGTHQEVVSEPTTANDDHEGTFEEAASHTTENFHEDGPEESHKEKDVNELSKDGHEPIKEEKPDATIAETALAIEGNAGEDHPIETPDQERDTDIRDPVESMQEHEATGPETASNTEFSADPTVAHEAESKIDEPVEHAEEDVHVPVDQEEKSVHKLETSPETTAPASVLVEPSTTTAGHDSTPGLLDTTPCEVEYHSFEHDDEHAASVSLESESHTKTAENASENVESLEPETNRHESIEPVEHHVPEQQDEIETLPSAEPDSLAAAEEHVSKNTEPEVVDHDLTEHTEHYNPDEPVDHAVLSSTNLESHAAAEDLDHENGHSVIADSQNEETLQPDPIEREVLPDTDGLVNIKSEFIDNEELADGQETSPLPESPSKRKSVRWEDLETPKSQSPVEETTGSILDHSNGIHVDDGDEKPPIEPSASSSLNETGNDHEEVIHAPNEHAEEQGDKDYLGSPSGNYTAETVSSSEPQHAHEPLLTDVSEEKSTLEPDHVHEAIQSNSLEGEHGYGVDQSHAPEHFQELVQPVPTEPIDETEATAHAAPLAKGELEDEEPVTVPEHVHEDDAPALAEPAKVTEGESQDEQPRPEGYQEAMPLDPTESPGHKTDDEDVDHSSQVKVLEKDQVHEPEDVHEESSKTATAITPKDTEADEHPGQNAKISETDELIEEAEGPNVSATAKPEHRKPISGKDEDEEDENEDEDEDEDDAESALAARAASLLGGIKHSLLKDESDDEAAAA